MSEKRENPYNVQGISFDSEQFLSNAKKRAKSLGLSFSKYVCQLVRNDLQDSGDIVIRPEANPALNETSSSSPPLGHHLKTGIAAGKLYARRQDSAPAPKKRKTAPPPTSDSPRDKTTAE